MTDKLTLAVNHALNDARMARARMGLMAPTMGLDNKRHSAWCEYGFPEQVTYENLYALYRRGGIAHGAVEKLVGKCWQTNPEIIEGDDADESKDETAWEKKTKKVFTKRLWRAFAEADRRRLVGRYAGILLHINDSRTWDQPVVRGKSLKKVTIAWAGSLTVSEWVTDQKSADYGQPKQWKYVESLPNGGTNQRFVHPDRVFILGDGVLTFTRDQKVGYPAAVFNRANMKTDEYKMTYEATLPGGYDGVQVSYVHPTTNNKTYINYRVLNGVIVEQEAENPNKLEIVGFRNEYQARERALRETKRLIYSRVKMNAKVFEDGIIQVGSVIQMPDIYDSNQQQGYITGRTGNDFDTSEPITFTGDMYVLVTDNMGNPTLRHPATARSDTKYGFTAAIPNIQLNIWNGDTVQLPSRYLIATVEELDSQLWTVNSIKPNTDNTVSLTVSEYSDSVYE
ncbi:TPA: host specificity factor TipJ family phage tail protein [Citrobacter freundii]|uniref:host specificity factor TipJ family phage tail protein n=1 Tax=Citrobacter freundii TaxID=546 RepID=UPI0022EA260B|nr:host specificity factor TipJ family phage tail protein [Citrobacter freundii]MDQ9167264.1 host specificity factor TipJ family phage tail protein [Citrobacter freundii]